MSRVRMKSNVQKKSPIDDLKKYSTCVDCRNKSTTDSISGCRKCQSLYKNSNSVNGSIKLHLSNIWDDQLFKQLLDDLDNISESSNESLRRRSQVRDLFSEWLFSHDMVECPNETEFIIEQVDSTLQDGIDSAYHTGESNNQQLLSCTSTDPSEATLSRDELRRQIDVFNKNDFGLEMCLEQQITTGGVYNFRFNGSIRIYLKLSKPIKMTPKMINEDEETKEFDMDTVKCVSFELPRNSSNLIRIDNTTTTAQVLQLFFKKHHFLDNPAKFSLYECSDKGEGHESIRRLSDDEYPLLICLNWSVDNLLDKRRFILRENDTTEILWDSFSMPELETFLKILQTEEMAFEKQIREKYAEKAKRLHSHIDTFDNKRFGNDRRSPVFV